MTFYHCGSDAEYNQLLARVPDDPRLNSLTYVTAAARWRKRYVKPKSWVDLLVDSPARGTRPDALYILLFDEMLTQHTKSFAAPCRAGLDKQLPAISQYTSTALIHLERP